jgi:hypothetical protein
VIDVKLTASQFELELYVEGYAFPRFDTGRDGNALACEIELDLQGRRLDLHAAHTLTLHTFDLADFVDQLRTLEHAPDGDATLGDPDEQSGDEFGLRIRRSEHQRAMLEGFLAEDLAARLTFELIDIDQAFIHHALAHFAAIVEAFPGPRRPRRRLSPGNTAARQRLTSPDGQHARGHVAALSRSSTHARTHAPHH